MLQIFGIAACIAIFAFLVTSAAALTWTAICMIAGGGIGCIATLLFIDGRWEKRQRQQELRREEDHQRMMELIYAAREMGARVDVPTLEIPVKKIQRVGKR